VACVFCERLTAGQFVAENNRARLRFGSEVKAARPQSPKNSSSTVAKMSAKCYTARCQTP